MYHGLVQKQLSFFKQYVMFSTNVRQPEITKPVAFVGWLLLAAVAHYMFSKYIECRGPAMAPNVGTRSAVKSQ